MAKSTRGKEKENVPLTLTAIRRQLKELADADVAEHSQRFFKTGPGQYGEGDEFLGIRVPVLRKLAKQFRNLPVAKVEALLRSLMHEERLLALLILVRKYERGDDATRSQVYELYCDNLAHVNNWDLVDSSAHKIVGPYLRDKDRSYLHELAHSDDLWKRRVAIISTLAYIQKGEHQETLAIAETLLHDKEDLIHKAVGWMLREMGKRDESLLLAFLKEHYREMPRTMLRYAIERLPERQRKQYLRGDA